VRIAQHAFAPPAQRQQSDSERSVRPMACIYAEIIYKNKKNLNPKTKTHNPEN
jgi:hypothetical protein